MMNKQKNYFTTLNYQDSSNIKRIQKLQTLAQTSDSDLQTQAQ